MVALVPSGTSCEGSTVTVTPEKGHWGLKGCPASSQSAVPTGTTPTGDSGTWGHLTSHVQPQGRGRRAAAVGGRAQVEPRVPRLQPRHLHPQRGAGGPDLEAGVGGAAGGGQGWVALSPAHGDVRRGDTVGRAEQHRLPPAAGLHQRRKAGLLRGICGDKDSACPPPQPAGWRATRGGDPQGGAALSPRVAGWRHRPGSAVPAGLACRGVPLPPPPELSPPDSQSTARAAGGARGPRPAWQP